MPTRTPAPSDLQAPHIPPAPETGAATAKKPAAGVSAAAVAAETDSAPGAEDGAGPVTALSADDLDFLDELLGDLRSRSDEIPQWEFCDGFLTALVCTRRAIPPAEYLPMLLGDGEALEMDTDTADGAALPLHCALMRNLGVALTEICDLEELAADCAQDRQFTFMYAAAPLKVAKAAGTPVNPMAIK